MFICREYTLSDVLQNLAEQIDRDGMRNNINVCRDEVMECAALSFNRSSFKPERPLKVRFVGEDSQDVGGPTRAFLQLAMNAVREMSIFAGPDSQRIIVRDSCGLY